MLAAAAAAVLIWGATPVVTKVAVGAVDPLVVGMLRTALAALIAAPVVVLARVPRPRTAAEAGLLALSTLGGFVAFPVLFTLGQAGTTASHGGLILALLPVLTGLFGAVAERAPPRPAWWVGAAVALAGEAALVGFRFGVGGAGASLAGDLMVLASCVAASLGYVAGGRLARTLGTWPTTLWGITLGGLVLAPFAVRAVGGIDWTTVGAAGYLGVAYLALLSSIVAYVAWYWALAHGGTSRAGAAQFAQPVVSLALAVALLGEPLTLPLALSAAVILAGIAVVQRR